MLELGLVADCKESDCAEDPVATEDDEPAAGVRAGAGAVDDVICAFPVSPAEPD